MPHAVPAPRKRNSYGKFKSFHKLLRKVHSNDLCSSFIAMNSIQDPSKKTSINSLLNPEASSAAYTSSIAASLNQAPHGQQLDVYETSFVNGSSFHLRAADWTMADDASKRKGEAGSTRLYQHMTPQEAYAGSSSVHAPRMGRTRVDGGAHYTLEGGQPAWHPQQNPANMPYGAPVVAPLYSDERTGESGPINCHQPLIFCIAISGDYQSHSQFIFIPPAPPFYAIDIHAR